MRRAATFLTIIVFLLSAASVRAQNPYDAPVQQLINRVWHNPCGGHISVVRVPMPLEGPNRALAWTYHGPWPLGSSYCVHYINSRVRFSPGAYCTVRLHEGGHSAGWLAPFGRGPLLPDGTRDPHHSENPRSIMAQSDIRWPQLDRRCMHIGKTFSWRNIDAPKQRHHLTVRGAV